MRAIFAVVPVQSRFSLKHFAFQAYTAWRFVGKRGFSAHFGPGGAVPPPRILLFSTAKCSMALLKLDGGKMSMGVGHLYVGICALGRILWASFCGFAAWCWGRWSCSTSSTPHAMPTLWNMPECQAVNRLSRMKPALRWAGFLWRGCFSACCCACSPFPAGAKASSPMSC